MPNQYDTQEAALLEELERVRALKAKAREETPTPDPNAQLTAAFQESADAAAAIETPTTPATSSGDGTLLDVATGAPVRSFASFGVAGEEGYETHAGTIVVGPDGSLRFKKLEATEGGTPA
jgi:hypothetical protein